MEINPAQLKNMNDIKEFALEWAEFLDYLETDSESRREDWEKERSRDWAEANQRADEWNQQTLRSWEDSPWWVKVFSSAPSARSVNSFRQPRFVGDVIPRTYSQPTMEGFIWWLGKKQRGEL